MRLLNVDIVCVCLEIRVLNFRIVYLIWVCVCLFVFFSFSSVDLFWFCRDDVNSNIMDAKYSTYIGCAILAVVLVVSPVIIFLVRNATNTIQVSFFCFHKNIQYIFGLQWAMGIPFANFYLEMSSLAWGEKRGLKIDQQNEHFTQHIHFIYLFILPCLIWFFRLNFSFC